MYETKKNIENQDLNFKAKPQRTTPDIGTVEL